MTEELPDWEREVLERQAAEHEEERKRLLASASLLERAAVVFERSSQRTFTTRVLCRVLQLKAASLRRQAM